MRLHQKTVSLLLAKKKTIALAESCTGGLVSNLLTDISGSSAFFWLGVIVYDNQAKEKILKIPASIINKHGAVSPQVAKLMATNVRRILKTDFGIGITGIAGPSGGSKVKPVGLVYISVAGKNKSFIEEFRFKGSRLAVKKQAANAALNMIMCALS